ncbi:MAG TPA: HAD family hydrolase [Clostridiales bacterium]|nr:HAD family hydrolase [Clostridiales bacterium]
MGSFDSMIFDLDGTLWNAVKSVTATWNRAVAKEPDVQKVFSENEIKNIMGLNTKEIGDKLFPGLPPQRREALMALCGEAERKELPKLGGILYPGVEETLRRLKERLPLFIVSNCDSGYIEAFLHYHHVEDCFRATLCYGDRAKEKAENIRSLVTAFALKNPVYIGDTEKDRLAAGKAGVSFLHAAYGFGHLETETPSINKISDLLQLL